MELGKPVGYGEFHEVDHAVLVKLLHDSGAVGLNGLVADAQLLSDHPAGLPVADELEDLAFALGELLA